MGNLLNSQMVSQRYCFTQTTGSRGGGGGGVEGGCCCRGRRQTGDVLLFVVTLDSSSCTKEWLRTRKTMSYQGARL